MIFIGDKNNSSKKIVPNSNNSYTPIKIGRHNNTASNVIKIFIGDKNNKAKEIYYIPLYDWRGLFTSQTGEHVEAIAKYSDNLDDRDPKIAYQKVDTIIINQLTEKVGDISYINLYEDMNAENFIYMSIYNKYIKNLLINNISKNLVYYGICGYNNYYSTSIPDYEELEHVVLDDSISEMHYCFTCTPNLKSVFIATNIIRAYDSFSSYYDGCVILLLKTGDKYYDNIVSKEGTYGTLLKYLCTENSDYYSDGLIGVNSTKDNSIIASDYVNNYYSIDDINNIIG